MQTKLDKRIDPKMELIEKLIKTTEGLNISQISALLIHAENYDSRNEAAADFILSKREVEVLTLLSNGYTRKDIGESLGISANTAARHISNIYSKLGISSAAEATQYACSVSLCRLSSHRIDERYYSHSAQC